MHECGSSPWAQLLSGSSASRVHIAIEIWEAMPRRSSCDTSASGLYEALRGLTGEEVDSIKNNKGSLSSIIIQIERKFREIDEKATFKRTAIEGAFVQFDKSRHRAFSKAAKLTPDEWGKQVRKEIRVELDKANKRMNSQAARDAAKAKKPEEPLPVKHRCGY